MLWFNMVLLVVERSAGKFLHYFFPGLSSITRTKNYASTTTSFLANSRQVEILKRNKTDRK